MGVVGHTQLVGDGQEQGVGLRDSLVRLELLDKYIRLGGVAASEDGAGGLIDGAGLVFLPTSTSEISAIPVVHEGEDASADRDTWLARVAGFFPRRAVGSDLGGFVPMGWLRRFVVVSRA